jgi:hypothetical protein
MPNQLDLSLDSKSTDLQRFDLFFEALVKPPVPWTRSAAKAVVALALIWAALMALTWASWGDVTADCGREMYVPTVLSEGKMLYRDVWYPYGPAAPYLNSILFRLFGVHLNVLYWAGSLSALGSAFFLFAIGMQLGAATVGWFSGAIVLVQAFASWIFSFPLPYSFASVYGCLVVCVFLWFIIRASASTHWTWLFGASVCAAAALLLKLEYGTACYITLASLIVARGLRERSWPSIAANTLMSLPGLMLCALVARWMVSIRGLEFITQENLVPWPTSYFMRTYGKVWLQNTGFTITPIAFLRAAVSLSVLGAVACGFHRLLLRVRSKSTLSFLWAEIVVVTLALIVPYAPRLTEPFFAWICFPQDMVLIGVVAAGLSWWNFFHRVNADNPGNLSIPLLSTFAVLLTFRVLMGMQPTGYSIYYNGPMLFSYILVLSALIVPEIRRSPSFTQQAQMLVGFSCFVAAAFYSNPFLALESHLVPLITERGTIRLSPEMAQNYQKAISFMKEKAAIRESVLSIPEDTSLYFLSATHCPTRLILFHPGVLVPGKMTDELIADIEKKRVRYLIWSNRGFAVYGAPQFGEDFDQSFANYLRTHYRPVESIGPDNKRGWWRAVIWERLPSDNIP